jgi:hypothetical protein
VRPSRLLIGMAWAAFAAGALWVVQAGGRRAAGGFAPASVFNQTPEGLSTAYRYLGERARLAGDGRPAPAVLAEPPRADNLPRDGVLFRVRPLLPPRASRARKEGAKGAKKQDEPEASPLTPAEEAWVRGGGRLVLALAESYGGVTLTPGRHSSPTRKVFPIWPGVRRLELAGAAPLPGGSFAASAHAIFLAGDAPVLSRVPFGRGDLILLVSPEILENDRLGQADHLRLLEALAGPGRPVVFDEWAHGLRREGGLFAELLAWGFGPALVVGGLAFVLSVWRGRARLGPEQGDPIERRSEAVDLVESLAQLYERALSRREAAALHLQAFRRAVSLRTGLTGGGLDRRVRDLLGKAAPPLPATGEIAASDFARRLSLVNDGYRRLYEHARTRRRA